MPTERSAGSAPASFMKTRFLETKFHVPPRRAGEILRPRLLESMHNGLRAGQKLTLISAPAGYGKTTLAAGWIHSIIDDRPPLIRAAWLSLDEPDNDTARFLGYCLASIQRAGTRFGLEIQNLLAMPPDMAPTAIMDDLINVLTGLEDRLVLVLDDYHVIANPHIHTALEYFIEHQPAQVHLALTTREDPPLPLARLRARGQMAEIRAQNLRFTFEEACDFFNRSMELDLDSETIRAVEARTEGWVTGLQLAALALQNLPSPHDFVETFRGSHRYVLDYLAEEVIRQQGEAIRQFLTQTCVLERFNADVCDALTGQTGSQAILARLEASNLFIIPLDHDRVWYRYHHLFADYLRSGLSKTEIAELYKSASLWHEQNDLIFESVRYALASGDHDFAADLVERAVQKESTWSGGDVASLEGWLDALPTPVLQARPVLSLHASRIFYLAGRFELAEKLLDGAEQYLAHAPVPGPHTERLLALVLLFRGGIAAVHGEVRNATEQTRRALTLLPGEERLAHARAAYSFGLAYELSGETEISVRTYLQSSELARAAGVLFLAINARCAAAQAQITQGKLHLAAQTCQEAIELPEQTPTAPVGLAWSILGEIAYEQNDLPGAEKYLQDGVELSRRGGLQDDLSLGLVFLARLKYGQGDTAGAQAALQQASAIVRAYRIPRLELLATAYLARLHLALGKNEPALAWARQYQVVRRSQPVEYLREFEDLTLARILMASGDLEAVPPILNALLEKAQIGGRVRTCIETFLLQALFQRASKNIPAAVDLLSQAVRLSAPEGIRSIFLEEGAPLTDLLKAARPAAPEFVDSLLHMGLHPGETRSTAAGELLDPLSEQEQRVLELVVAGKSNQEIAAELFISAGTAKWHVHNILQKLGVHNRPQLIARVHELHIL